MIGGTTNDICSSKKFPGERVSMSQKECNCKLQYHDCENDIFCKWLMTHELSDLKKRLEDISPRRSKGHEVKWSTAPRLSINQPATIGRRIPGKQTS